MNLVASSFHPDLTTPSKLVLDIDVWKQVSISQKNELENLRIATYKELETHLRYGTALLAALRYHQHFVVSQKPSFLQEVDPVFAEWIHGSSIANTEWTEVLQSTGPDFMMRLSRWLPFRFRAALFWAKDRVKCVRIFATRIQKIEAIESSSKDLSKRLGTLPISVQIDEGKEQETMGHAGGGILKELPIHLCESAIEALGGGLDWEKWKQQQQKRRHHRSLPKRFHQIQAKWSNYILVFHLCASHTTLADATNLTHLSEGGPLRVLTSTSLRWIPLPGQKNWCVRVEPDIILAELPPGGSIDILCYARISMAASELRDSQRFISYRCVSSNSIVPQCLITPKKEKPKGWYSSRCAYGVFDIENIPLRPQNCRFLSGCRQCENSVKVPKNDSDNAIQIANERKMKTTQWLWKVSSTNSLETGFSLAIRVTRAYLDYLFDLRKQLLHRDSSLEWNQVAIVEQQTASACAILPDLQTFVSASSEQEIDGDHLFDTEWWNKYDEKEDEQEQEQEEEEEEYDPANTNHRNDLNEYDPDKAETVGDLYNPFDIPRF